MWCEGGCSLLTCTNGSNRTVKDKKRIKRRVLEFGGVESLSCGDLNTFEKCHVIIKS